jgi:peptidoglycan/LPS O-acetylase OafA/YrhL
MTTARSVATASPVAGEPPEAEGPLAVATPRSAPAGCAKPRRTVVRDRSGLRFRPSGDEAGTPLADRSFRPDVEGLRAVAVALVVLYHAGVPGVSGGFVGVDVFYVVSGFVITGLLLRERAVDKRNDLIAFYARRCRRILPAATLVVIVSVLASYHWLGFVFGAQVAGDGQAAALFAANFHFIANGTNYINSKLPPSPLQNFWSLAVEEQFYLVYPTLFIAVAAVCKRRYSLATKLAAVLGCVTVASYLWSINQTGQDSVAAYFSPFTRAWELALGALVAVLTPRLQALPKRLAALAAWLGLGMIVLAALWFGSWTAYPGSAAALPVAGAALVIGAGAAVPALGAERLLRLRPFQWLGKLSYSLYLWHWPLLVIAMEYATRPLSLAARLGWVAAGLGASVVTYLVLENPVRHARFLAERKWLSVGMGASLAGLSLLVIAVVRSTHP